MSTVGAREFMVGMGARTRTSDSLFSNAGRTRGHGEGHGEVSHSWRGGGAVTKGPEE
jgi:hypothetical protein